MKTRKIYKFVDELIVKRENEPEEMIKKIKSFFKKEIANMKKEANNIANFLSNTPPKNPSRIPSIIPEMDQIIVEMVITNYGMKDQDPVKFVKFYKGQKETISFSSETVSLLLPHQFEEVCIHILFFLLLME